MAEFKAEGENMPRRIRRFFGAFLTSVTILGVGGPVHAGIPVIDTANLTQSITSVIHQVTALQNQIQQIVQLQTQIESISRARNLGDVLNNPLLHNYVPREATNLIRSLETGGYATLSGSARALRDANMLFNCATLPDPERTRCQAELARPYQQKAFMTDALEIARDRVSQINSLMARAGSTTDAKEIAEVQARIAGENALLQHELSQIQMMRGVAEAEQRIAESRAREGQLEQASRTRRLADFYTP